VREVYIRDTTVNVIKTCNVSKYIECSRLHFKTFNVICDNVILLQDIYVLIVYNDGYL
jgi:hypothetical protein